MRPETSSYLPPALFALRAVWEYRVPQPASTTAATVRIGIFTSLQRLYLAACRIFAALQASPLHMAPKMPAATYTCIQRKRSWENFLQQCRINANPAWVGSRFAGPYTFSSKQAIQQAFTESQSFSLPPVKNGLIPVFNKFHPSQPVSNEGLDLPSRRSKQEFAK